MNRTQVSMAVLAVMAGLSFAHPAFGATGEAAGVHGGQEHAEAEEHHGEHSNEIALVLGGTYESEEKETFFTWGLEYERVLGDRLGVSLVAEHVTGVDAIVLVAPFVYRPVAAVKLAAGPGLEAKPRRPGSERGHASDSHGEDPEMNGSGDESHFLWRVGAGYSFHVGSATVTPALDLDLVREHGRWVEALVFDVSIGFGF